MPSKVIPLRRRGCSAAGNKSGPQRNKEATGMDILFAVVLVAAVAAVDLSIRALCRSYLRRAQRRSPAM